MILFTKETHIEQIKKEMATVRIFKTKMSNIPEENQLPIKRIIGVADLLLEQYRTIKYALERWGNFSLTDDDAKKFINNHQFIDQYQK